MVETTSVSPRDVVILGSTGSIGTQTVEVISQFADKFRVVGVAAGGRNVELLAKQAVQLRPDVVVVADSQAVDPVVAAIRALAARDAESGGQPYSMPQVESGQDRVAALAGNPCDVVVNGVDGGVGLTSTLAALTAGNVLALANKESLIVGGELVHAAVGGAEKVLDRIVPIDSETAAIAQCLGGGRPDEVAGLVLTASGGPFRGKQRADLAGVTVEQALEHPTWSMGTVNTINSATMMNKSLEIIESHLLFGVPYDQIEVTVHPQSVVHSMVRFCDGSIVAQCAPPDMKLAIAWGLSAPGRLPGVVASCDWSAPSAWTFEPVDTVTFPATDLAREVGKLSGTFPAVFNAANEECLTAFLAGELPFLQITDTVVEVVRRHHDAPQARTVGAADMSTGVVLAAQQWARGMARQVISGQA